MSVQIDNKKMWESLIEIGEHCQHGKYIELKDIYGALNQQGLKYNQETGEIVSIEPEPRFKKGDWVVYTDPIDGGECLLQVKGFVYETYEFTGDSTLNYTEEYCMRPATEEEVANHCKDPHKGHYHFTGIGSKEATGKLKEMVDKIDEESIAKTEEKMEKESISPAPQRDNFDELKQADSEELSEFEEAVRNIITSELCNNFGDVSFGISISNEEAKLIAKKLLSIAEKEIRKQIASEIDVDSMIKKREEELDSYGMSPAYIETRIRGYKDCLEDMLHKNKGE